jgi:hypothetical protein
MGLFKQPTPISKTRPVAPKSKETPGEDALLHVSSPKQTKDKPKASVRTSAKKKRGLETAELVLKSRAERINDRNSAAASKLMAEALAQAETDRAKRRKKTDGTHGKNREAGRMALRLEEVLTTGNLLDMQEAVHALLARPLVHEIRHSNAALFQSKLETSDDVVKDMIVKQVRALVTEIFQTKGTRLRRDQDMLNGALAAVVYQDVFEKRLGRACQRVLGVSYPALKKACADRESLEKDRHWVQRKRKKRGDGVSDRGIGIISDWLHDGAPPPPTSLSRLFPVARSCPHSPPIVLWGGGDAD